MKWLITTSGGMELGALKSILAKYGVHLSETAPQVPLGDEFAVEVEGPDDLPSRVRGENRIRVYPSSDFTLQGE